MIVFAARSMGLPGPARSRAAPAASPANPAAEAQMVLAVMRICLPPSRIHYTEEKKKTQEKIV